MRNLLKLLAYNLHYKSYSILPGIHLSRITPILNIYLLRFTIFGALCILSLPSICRGNTEQDSIIKVLIDSSIYYIYKKGDMVSTKRIGEELERIVPVAADTNYSDLLRIKSSVAYFAGEYTKAIEFSEERLAINTSLNDSSRQLFDFRILSNLHYFKGHLDKSQEYNIRCIHLSSVMKEYGPCATCIQNKAGIHSDLKEYDLGYETYVEAIRMLDTVPFDNENDRIFYLVYNNFARLAIELKDTSAMRTSIAKHKALFSKDDDIHPFDLAGYYSNNALYFKTINELDSALVYNHLAIEKYSQTSNFSELTRDLNLRGELFYLNNMIDSSLVYITKSLEKSTEIGLLAVTAANHKLLSKIYEVKGKPKAALESFLKYDRLKDSLHTKETEEELERLKTTYEHAQRDDKLAIQKLSLRENQLTISKKKDIISLLLLTLVILVALIGVLLFLRKALKSKYLQISHQNKVILKAQEEIKQKSDQIKNLAEQKERELFSNYLISSKNSLIIEDCIKKLNKVQLENDIKNLEIRKTIKSLELNLDSNERWDDFNYQFKSIEPLFITNLSRKFTFLTQKELKHCAFVRLNLSNKETANLLGISPKSVEVARYRIKKRIGLKAEDSLYSFLNKDSFD